ncbi:hypothetical protein [Pseudorhodoferax sp.]|uniref:hypothetical protein n=1 Tax=Pseudorhodoferax sp. TaxID=1993553 RepID=UPI0039E6C87F
MLSSIHDAQSGRQAAIVASKSGSTTPSDTVSATGARDMTEAQEGFARRLRDLREQKNMPQPSRGRLPSGAGVLSAPQTRGIVMTAAVEQGLRPKTRMLSPRQVAEVEAFVEFLAARARKRAALDRLLAIAPALRAAGAQDLSEGAIAAEVDAARAERRAQQAAKDSGADRSRDQRGVAGRRHPRAHRAVRRRRRGRYPPASPPAAPGLAGTPQRSCLDRALLQAFGLEAGEGPALPTYACGRPASSWARTCCATSAGKAT